MRNPKDIIRIGGASGFWGEASLATAQLLDDGGLDFIVYDYLAEITMAILGRMRAKDPALGYATDFIHAAMVPNLGRIAKQGVKIISNAGGVNPVACAQTLRKAIAHQGLDLRVAIIEGDDLLDRASSFAQQNISEMFSNAPFPDLEKIGSINAYLGAFPIAAALDQGADIVLTGRCVDSAVTLAACIHSFGWNPTQFDRLAGGSLAGHILECGPQTTGGNFTDWEQIGDGFASIGYPIAEVSPAGDFILTKPANTGGLVSVGTVSEQMLYEIGDPQNYLLPDVACDFSGVSITKTGLNRVAVSKAKGRPPTDSYKTCLTFLDGYRGGHLFGFYGTKAEARAQTFANAAFERSRATLSSMSVADFSETSVEILGAESQYGVNRQDFAPREVTAKIAVKHAEATGVGIFLREATGLSLSAPPGLCGFAGARPKPSPVLALYSFLLPKQAVSIRISDGSGVALYHQPPPGNNPIPPIRPPEPTAEFAGDMTTVPLIKLAWARSGDKGDTANIGIIARRAEYLPYIWAALDQAVIKGVFAHFLKGKVERFLLPGSHAMNILMYQVLSGGGVSSLRNDPQGKGYAQLLLDHPIRLPTALLKDPR